MQSLRFLLYPLSILYDGITGLRNWSFDNGFLDQKSFDVPVIVVGNLSTGGTGKTPMIEFLIRKYSGNRVAVLSRGYGRRTKGYKEVNVDSLASEVGDEPLQFKAKYRNQVVIAVCEKRVDGIERIMNSHNVDLILLDDAFQHRYVKGSYYFLMTSYNQPYFEDYLLPAGNLRESRSGASRADGIIITKCPQDLSFEERDSILKSINPSVNQKVYFSTIAYSDRAIGIGEEILVNNLSGQSIAIVTGIAKPLFFVDHLNTNGINAKHYKFPDHYNYKKSDLEKLENYDVILTTEKDYVRLKEFKLKNLYYIGIETRFLWEEPQINISGN